MKTRGLIIFLLIILFITIGIKVESRIATNKNVQTPNLCTLNNRMPPDILREEATPIEKDVLYSDSLPTNGSKSYVVYASEKSILILFIVTDIENAKLTVDLKGPVESMYLYTYLWGPYFYYVKTEGEIRITISNFQKDTNVDYRFFVDTSEPLQSYNSKVLPVEGGLVSFHTDLKKDDRVRLKLNSSTHLQLRQRVYTPCLEWIKGKRRYMLSPYTEASETLSLTANTKGRYYIIVESIKGAGTLSLSSTVISPPWNQEWFWPTVWFGFTGIVSSYFITKIKRIRNLDKAARYSVLSGYWSLITLGLLSSLIGAFEYGTSVFIPLLYASGLFYGLNLAIRVYSSYLDRKITSAVCPQCGRKVDLKTENYCCGKKIKKVSDGWYLAPVSFSLLFFLIGHLIFTQPSNSLLLGGGGSILGGIIAWWMAANRGTYKKKGRNFLAAGIIFSFIMPVLITLTLETILVPYIELDWPGKLLRQRIAPPSLSQSYIILFAISASFIAFFAILEVRHHISRKKLKIPVDVNF